MPMQDLHSRAIIGAAGYIGIWPEKNPAAQAALADGPTRAPDGRCVRTAGSNDLDAAKAAQQFGGPQGGFDLFPECFGIQCDAQAGGPLQERGRPLNL